MNRIAIIETVALVDAVNDARRESAKCRVCGCTDQDCRQCIERTGQACHWVKPDVCSACARLCPACKTWTVVTQDHCAGCDADLRGISDTRHW